jgi:hypothetical protein
VIPSFFGVNNINIDKSTTLTTEQNSSQVKYFMWSQMHIAISGNVKQDGLLKVL